MADPYITLSEADSEKLHQAFRDTFVQEDSVNHTFFTDKCRQAKNCKNENICKEKGCKALSDEFRRNYRIKKSVRFRRSTLDVLCKVLYGTPFSEWPESSQSPYSPSGTRILDTFQSGFVRIHEKGEYFNQATSILKEATQEVWLYDYSLEISLAVGSEYFLNSLRKGVKIHIIFLSPLSNQISQLAYILGEEEHTLKTACDNSIIRVLQRLKQCHSYLVSLDIPYHEAFSVRITNDIPRMGAYLYDPQKSTGKSFFLPSVNQAAMMNLPIFEFKNVPSGVCSIYMEGIRKEWAAAIPLSVFLNQHPEFLEKYYPSFFSDYPQVSNTDA